MTSSTSNHKTDEFSMRIPHISLIRHLFKPTVYPPDVIDPNINSSDMGMGMGRGIERG